MRWYLTVTSLVDTIDTGSAGATSAAVFTAVAYAAAWTALVYAATRAFGASFSDTS